jgi:hypothetical protein
MELKRRQKNIPDSSEEREREGLVGLGMTDEEIEVWYGLAKWLAGCSGYPSCILWSSMRSLMTFISSKIVSWGAPGFGQLVGPDSRASYA